MKEPSHRIVSTNGISMHVTEIGDGTPVVLCHGFPELWYSWRHQLPALAEAGYHAIAPDQRGYGRTDRPSEVDQYDILHLTDDLLGLLDALGEDRAVFVGHDWGAIVVWQLALIAPQRIAAVVGMSVPFLPRPPVPPVQLLRALAGERFMYILYFQDPGPADQELGRDPRGALAKVLCATSGSVRAGSFLPPPARPNGWLDTMPDQPAELPAWLTPHDLDVYAAEFSGTGFTGGLNWYRNLDRNWELTDHLSGAKVAVPAMFIAGERDPVLRLTPIDVMDGWLDDDRGRLLVPGAGHWVQQERPDEVNEALVAFLSGLRTE